MKALQRISMTLLIILVLLTIIGFFLPRKVTVKRSQVIFSNSETVFEQVNTLKNWEKWSPWHQTDPLMKLTYNNVPSGAGAKYTWSSSHKRVGSGSLTILGSNPNDSIACEMNFSGKGLAQSWFLISKADSGCRVTWKMNTDVGFNPVSRYFGLALDNMTGKDFEKGLINLKKVCESRPAGE